MRCLNIRGPLLADCANRRLVPNPKHPDYPVLSLK